MSSCSLIITWSTLTQSYHLLIPPGAGGGDHADDRAGVWPGVQEVPRGPGEGQGLQADPAEPPETGKAWKTLCVFRVSQPFLDYDREHTFVVFFLAFKYYFFWF